MTRQHSPIRRPRLAAVITAAVVSIVPTASVAMAASTTPSPSASASSTLPTNSSTFTEGFLQDVDNLNPFIGILASTYEVWGVTYDFLVGYSQKNFSPEPELASSWQESADHTTWTFHLHHNVKWSDGFPMTSADVVYTFNRILHNTFEQTNYGNYVANIKSVTAPDINTVVFTVTKPTPIMLHMLVPILPEHIWKNISETAVQSYPNSNIVGTGPFTLVQHVTGQFLRFKANPNYFLGAPHIKQLVFRIFQDESTMVAALRKGEIDMADGLKSTSFNALKSDKQITTVPALYSGFDEIAMNTGAATVTGQPIGDGNPALKDLRVRQAIQYAIDRKTLVDKVLGGYGSVGNSVIPPIYQSLHYDPGNTAFTFDLSKANQILDDAGYKRGAGGIRVAPDGKQLSLRLFGRSDSPTSQQTVQYVSDWLQQIGIQIKVQIVSEDNLTQIIGDGDYDLFEWGWVVEPDPDYQLSTFTCAQRSTKSGSTITAGLSDSFYCNPAYDALYAQQATETNLAQRAATVKQAQAMLYQAANYAVTFYYDDLEAYRNDRFTNFKPQPDPGGALVFQYGAYSYRFIEPVSTVTPTSNKTAASLAIGAVIVVLLIGGGMFLARRTRSSVEDRA
jgi:peptide/nickel transport system substrate-binding protein